MLFGQANFTGARQMCQVVINVNNLNNASIRVSPHHKVDFNRKAESASHQNDENLLCGRQNVGQ